METIRKAMEGIGPVPVANPTAPEVRREEDKPFEVDRRSPHQRKLARLLPGGWKQLEQISQDEKIANEQAKSL